MPKFTRRGFLGTSAAIGAVNLLGSAAASPVGANDKLRIAIAGLNGRGKSHIESCLKLKDVEIAYLIDPDTRTFAERVKLIESKGRKAPVCVQDVRQVLEDKSVDAVSIATPNHWHSLMTIWACQAGKDVYVEKPCSHNVHEGRIAVEMARKHDRIVQHGTQSRSDAKFARLAALAKSGKLGKLQVSRALVYKRRKSIGVKPAAQPPKEVAFDLWLGPAQEQPFHGNLVHYNWHWFWDFGNGDIGNQGVHQMDVARWLIPDATLPKTVFSLGGRFGYTDQGQTPNTQITLMDFGQTKLLFEVRGLETDKYYQQGVGNILHFEEGVVADKLFWPKGAKEPQPLPDFGVKADRAPRGDHYANFVAACKSHKREDLNADILEGHLSSALCHLANISYRLGTEATFNSETKSFGDDREVFEAFARMEEHLTKGNGLKLDGVNYRVGKKLTVDAAAESFVDSPDACRLLTRAYRSPFEVPDKVV